MRALIFLLTTCIFQINCLNLNQEECIQSAMKQFSGLTFEEFHSLQGNARDTIGNLILNGSSYSRQCLSVIDDLFGKVVRFYRVYDRCMGISSAQNDPAFAKRIRTICYLDERERKGI